ncbi:MAG: hydrogenase nickel incorporation protein HypB [Saprospiraceae bacterium]|nr:hydrogenase nickel incorporation protein HypB [Saprospiraceae bacterium]
MKTMGPVPFATATEHHHHGHHHHHDHGSHHHETGHIHSHGDHGHPHVHFTSPKTVVDLEVDILQQNQLLAERNRGYFLAKSILALNLVSSPGSGKTSLLERTLTDLKGKMDCAVIEGDQQSSQDASRIAATSAPVVQINTGKGCHLDADMVSKALQQLKPANNSLLFIENVGNLVCPALFDLGEAKRVVIISVTEGDDKPIKYPDMFHSAQLCIINKIDLLPYVQFDVNKAKDYALQVNHHLKFLELSATTGQGMDQWYQWLEEEMSRIG